MRIKSLGLQTDLLFRRFEGEVIERESHIVVRTPKNPGYRWGNFILFQNPPKAGDLENWKEVFAREIGVPPTYTHFAFTWDDLRGDVGEIEPFLTAGFKLDQSSVMTAQSVSSPPKVNTECIIRSFTANDWQTWLRLEIATNAAEPEETREDDSDGGFSRFLEAKVAEYQRMIKAGLGQWFGAFVGDDLASSLGLFVWEKLGRFQSVATHPDFRRRGLAGTLVYETAKKGFNEMGAETLVICADPDYIALKIYESVGFKMTEQTVGIDWHPTNST